MTKGEDIKLEWIEDRFDMQWQIVNTARIMELLHHVQHVDSTAEAAPRKYRRRLEAALRFATGFPHRKQRIAATC